MVIHKDGILDNVLNLRARVFEKGKVVRNTKELTNVHLDIRDINYGSSYEEAFSFYKEGALGEAFSATLNSEFLNYTSLKFALLQKIEFNRFYFNEDPTVSRKLIVHSEDCISTLQILARECESEDERGIYTTSLEAGVYMRSTDVVNLLHADLLGIASICDGVAVSRLPDFGDVKMDINILIGSAHIYTEKDPRGLESKFLNHMIEVSELRRTPEIIAKL